MGDWRSTPLLDVGEDSRPKSVESQILGDPHQVTETALREFPAHKKYETDLGTTLSADFGG